MQSGFLWTLALAVLLSSSVEAVAEPSAEEANKADDPDRKAFRYESKPVWEIGIGGGYSRGFDYPASASRNNRSLFLPYAIYRGQTVRMGSGRLQAVAFEKPRFTLDFSLSASFDADSEDNQARKGMPDLDFLFEIGPRLQYRLIDQKIGENSRSKLSWENYLRAVLSTDFNSLDSRGARFGSRLRYRYSNIADSGSDFFARVGPVWASSGLQDYFYQVDERYETDSRPRYNAGGGYLGTELFYGFRLLLHKNLRVIIGSTIGYYKGAENQSSPLFESERTTSYMMAVIWSIRQSKDNIRLIEDD